VGVIERLPAGERSGLHVGQRVASILPRMGAHASLISIAPSLLVPVPDLLDSAIAATVPLDAVTALFALDALAVSSGAVLVQGAGGAVGSWVAQLATARGLTVCGTASPRSRAYAERFTASVFDYADPTWIEQLLDVTAGGVDGAIDHTGGGSVRQAVRAAGRVVRTAFGGEPARDAPVPQQALPPRRYAAMRGRANASVPCRSLWQHDAPGTGRRSPSSSRRSATAHSFHLARGSFRSRNTPKRSPRQPPLNRARRRSLR
jgi:NADPH:quinone reductase and related Zn-dependent oxidoreductases